MSDSAGDGWNGAVLYIGPTIALSLVKEGSNAVSGYYQQKSVCLPAGTYAPFACGGTKMTEVWWLVGGVVGTSNAACSSAGGAGSTFLVEPCKAVGVSMTDSFKDGWNGNWLHLGDQLK